MHARPNANHGVGDDFGAHVDDQDRVRGRRRVLRACRGGHAGVRAARLEALPVIEIELNGYLQV